MGVTKNLNRPEVYAEALARAVLDDNLERLAVWLAEDDQVVDSPLWKWYAYFAQRLLDAAPRPELGFKSRTTRIAPAPKIGRNDICPCGSGKKYKVCHLDKEEVVGWKLGTPTPMIRAMAIAQVIGRLPPEQLDRVPSAGLSPLVMGEMAAAYHRDSRVDQALVFLRQMLDGPRDDPHTLYDYWIARYAEWLVEAGRDRDAEEYLMDEYDSHRGVAQWQVAQKLAAFHLDRGAPDQAEVWVESALSGNPDNSFNHYLNALMHHYTSNWDAAISAYEQALELSRKYRRQEEEYMVALATEGLEKARNRQSLDEETETAQEEGNQSA